MDAIHGSAGRLIGASLLDMAGGRGAEGEGRIWEPSQRGLDGALPSWGWCRLVRKHSIIGIFVRSIEPETRGCPWRNRRRPAWLAPWRPVQGLAEARVGIQRVHLCPPAFFEFRGLGRGLSLTIALP